MQISIVDNRQESRDLVPEVIVREIEEVGFSRVARVRARVDRDPKPLAATFEQDVIVRTLAPALRLPVDDSAAEEAVAPDSHNVSPARTMTRARRASRTGHSAVPGSIVASVGGTS